MKKNVAKGILTVLCMWLFGSCGNANMSNELKSAIPQELLSINEEYYLPAAQRGTLVELYYDTYESKTYAQKTQPIQKRAIVYLPYGYSDEDQYNVFYLMHGGWGNETTTLGTPDDPSPFKNVIDNAIASGEIDPLIIVYRLLLPVGRFGGREDGGQSWLLRSVGLWRR